MPGSPATIEEKERYTHLRQMGATQVEAASKVGRSKSWAHRFETSGMIPVEIKAKFPGGVASHRKAELVQQPVPRERLCDGAVRSLEDFELFRARYFGRRSSPWQIEAGQRIVELLGTPDKEFVVINCPPGAGKALALDTPLLTTEGWQTVGSVRPGEYVYAPDGTPTEVVAVSEVWRGRPCFKVSSDDGAWVVADGEHLWPVRLHGEGLYKRTGRPDEPHKTGPKTRGVGGVRTQTTDFLSRPRAKRPALATTDPLRFAERDLPVDPYVLGVWLGDGSSSGGRVTAHPDDAKWLRSFIEEAGYVTTDHAHPQNFGVLRLQGQLRKLRVLGRKHVPWEYLTASEPQRLALLQGLIDTDGHVDPKGQIEFCNTNRDLAFSVQFLARTLGVKASLTEKRATIDGRDCGEVYNVRFYLARAARLPRKAERTRDAIRTTSRYLTVTPAEPVPTRCIQVAHPSGCFLAGQGLMVTHNSTLIHDLFAWLIVRDRAVRCLMGSRTERQASAYSARVKRTLERRHLMKAKDDEARLGLAGDAEATLVGDFGPFKPPLGEEIWRREQFTVIQQGETPTDEKESTVTAFGMDSGQLGWRVKVTGWDDLVDRSTVKTQASVEGQQEWWETEGETRVEPGGVCFLVGQRISSVDLYRFCLDLSAFSVTELDAEGDLEVPVDGPRKYHHIVYKAHDEDRCSGVHQPGVAEPWPRGCLLDPVRVPWRELRHMMGSREQKFRVLYQQEDVDPAAVLVPKLWVDGGRDPASGEEFPGCWDRDRRVGELPAGLRPPLVSVATADPSPTKFWAIEWFVWQPSTGLVFLMDLERRAMDAPDFLDWNEQSRSWSGVMQEWQQRARGMGVPIQWWVVEQNAAQRFILQYDHFRRWQRHWGVRVIGHETSRNKADAELGMEASIQPVFRRGLLRLPGSQDGVTRTAALKLVDEATRYPDVSTDDTLMALWFFLFNRHRFEVTPVERQPKASTPAFLREAS